METTNRKRPLKAKTDLIEDCEETPENSLERSTKRIASTKSLPSPPSMSIRRLRLEAIFHPKFDNENTNTQYIRQQMKEKVNKQHGYLEVSLKHSGSLILWSGSQRYYSKNSTANSFTYVGELLLRQHFMRAWYNPNNNIGSHKATGEEMYKACSDYVEKNRLTLAFEVVTSVLGHHGDIPKQDFLILTTVADKSMERFYTTSQLVEMAQRFRLPHNDFWIHNTTDSVSQLFHLYDTMRETGLASDTIQELNNAANVHIPSMYPHVEFQGDILEGVVIRYVAYEQQSHQDEVEGRITHQNKLDQLASVSNDILALVPPSRPPCFQLEKDDKKSIYSANVRELFRECSKAGYTDIPTRLSEGVYKILNNTDSSRRSAIKRPKSDWDLIQIVKNILTDDECDEETKRIARVIQKADALNATMTFAVFRENNSRWLCVIHILHDKSFLKYQKAMETDDMHLFRGFCIEMGTDVKQHVKEEDNGGVCTMDLDHASFDPSRLSSDGSQLMLKMKLLPYMVRTFCCRNGLKYIEQGGPTQFTSYTIGLMNKWNISQSAQATWLPFFKAWGQYVYDVKNDREREYIDTSLPGPVKEDFYLDHLQHFEALYEAGKIQSSVKDEYSSSRYRAIVIVVSISKATAQEFASRLSKALGGVRLKDIEEIQEQDCIESRMEVGGGLICFGDVECNRRNFKQVMKKFSDMISLVLVDCDDDSIDSKLLQNPRKTKGITRSWQKMKFVQALNVFSEIFDEESKDAFDTLLSQLVKVSESVPVLDARPGLLVFFPAIPGCGKSALSSTSSCQQIKQVIAEKVSETHSEKERTVKVLIGDQIKEKYWPAVKSLKLEESASVLIADKNAPESAWVTVASSVGNAMAVPVIPDDQSLATTTVHGLRKSNGDFDPEVKHFYPFSLPYLAVCMARVLSRPPKSHTGKLDRGTPAACMVVVKFFCLYRNILSDGLLDLIQLRFVEKGSWCSPEPIKVPFFKTNVIPKISDDLKEALINAIQLQLGFDIEKKDITKSIHNCSEIQKAEQQLRTLIEKESNSLNEMVANEDISRTAFVEAILCCVLERIDNRKGPGKGAQMLNRDFVKLVSIDIPMEIIHSKLLDLSQDIPELQQCLIDLGIQSVSKKSTTSCSDELPNNLVRNTHITMAHFSNMNQSDIYSQFDSLIGKNVNIRWKALLWNEGVAAIEVDVPTTIEGNDEQKIPPSTNTFQHVTISVAEGSSAVESNALPMGLDDGKTNIIRFQQERDTVVGSFSFWKPDKSSK